MKAGLLKENIKILYSKNSASEYGESRIEWIVKSGTRANVTYKSHNRTNENYEIFFDTVVEFKVRYYVEVDERDRILWNDKQYRILSLLPDKTKQEKTIITELINE